MGGLSGNFTPGQNLDKKSIISMSCETLQEGINSEIGARVAKNILPSSLLCETLDQAGTGKYISRTQQLALLRHLKSASTLTQLSEITEKLNFQIGNENAEFILSLFSDNKISPEIIISKVIEYVENYENVLNVDSDEIHQLGENVFAYKNSQGFYRVAYKNLEGKIILFTNHPKFLKIPSKHSNNIFSGCNEYGGYIFQITSEDEDIRLESCSINGDFDRIRYHFFENATQISELHFDQQTQESFFDITYNFPTKKYESTPQEHEILTLDKEFIPKLLNSNGITFSKTFFLNGVLIASDGEFPNPHDDNINGIHSFYSLTGKKLLEMKGYFNGELESENIISIVNDDGKIFIEIKNGNIYILNHTPFYFSTPFAKNIFQGGQVFLTTDGKVGTYSVETKTLEFFDIPNIKDIIRVNVYDNQDLLIGGQTYIFNNGKLYKARHGFTLKDYCIYKKNGLLKKNELVADFSQHPKSITFETTWNNLKLDDYLEEVERKIIF